MTYKEISAKYNLSLRDLYNRVHLLRIEGKYKRGLNFSKSQVKQIIEYNPKAYLDLWRKDNDVRKITIIEFYLKFGGVNKVSRMLNINRRAVGNTIKEYEETGYIVVASKLNTMEEIIIHG